MTRESSNRKTVEFDVSKPRHSQDITYFGEEFLDLTDVATLSNRGGGKGSISIEQLNRSGSSKFLQNEYNHQSFPLLYVIPEGPNEQEPPSKTVTSAFETNGFLPNSVKNEDTDKNAFSFSLPTGIVQELAFSKLFPLPALRKKELNSISLLTAGIFQEPVFTITPHLQSHTNVGHNLPIDIPAGKLNVSFSNTLNYSSPVKAKRSETSTNLLQRGSKNAPKFGAKIGSNEPSVETKTNSQPVQNAFFQQEFGKENGGQIRGREIVQSTNQPKSFQQTKAVGNRKSTAKSNCNRQKVANLMTEWNQLSKSAATGRSRPWKSIMIATNFSLFFLSLVAIGFLSLTGILALLSAVSFQGLKTVWFQEGWSCNAAITVFSVLESSSKSMAGMMDKEEIANMASEDCFLLATGVTLSTTSITILLLLSFVNVANSYVKAGKKKCNRVLYNLRNQSIPRPRPLLPAGSIPDFPLGQRLRVFVNLKTNSTPKIVPQELVWKLWRGGRVEVISGSLPNYEMRNRGITFS